MTILWREPEIGKQRLFAMANAHICTATPEGKIITEFDIEDPSNPAYMLVTAYYRKSKHEERVVSFLLLDDRYAPLDMTWVGCNAFTPCDPRYLVLSLPEARNPQELRLTVADIQFINYRITKHIKKVARSIGLI